MSVDRILPRLLPMITPILLLTVGCGDSLPTAPTPALDASADLVGSDPGHSMEELPFRLTADAVLVGQEFAPGFGPPDFGKSDFDGRCSMPSDFLIRFSLEGEATHLGEFTGVAEHCTRVDFATGRFTILDGVLTYTAANGDKLWDHYAGAGSMGAAAAPTTEAHQFVGGTGRFLGASGGGTAHPVCDQAAGTCRFALEGTILYDASARGR